MGNNSNNITHVSDCLVTMEKCTRSKENGVRYMYGYGCVFLIWNVEQIVEEIDAVHVIYLATEVEFV